MGSTNVSSIVCRATRRFKAVALGLYHGGHIVIMCTTCLGNTARRSRRLMAGKWDNLTKRMSADAQARVDARVKETRARMPLR